jgi:hypothetical protein
MYKSATIAQNKRNTAQEEWINRLETLLQNISIPNKTPLTPSQTRTEPTVEVTEDRTRIVIQRPWPRLPDPAMFAGSSSEWPSWRTVMENKLAVDGEAIGSPQDQFAYVFSWLEKMALKNTNSFMKTQQNDHEPQQLLSYLKNIYSNPNIKARAARRLHLIQQHKDQSFAKFLP